MKSEKFGIPELYKYYRSKFTLSERKSNCIVDNKSYAKIIKDCNKELARMIIEENLEFKMPVRMGTLRIKKYKKFIPINPDGSINIKYLIVNWEATWNLWYKEYPGLSKEELKKIHGKPLVYQLNEHTEGYFHILYWNKKGSNADNRAVYSIRFTRGNNRHMASILKGNRSVNYYE